LCNFIILATFKTSKKIHFFIDLFIKLHITGVVADLAILREILYTPVEFDCILLIFLLTSFIVQGLKTNLFSTGTSN